MQAELFDRYQTGSSPVHCLDPRVKVLAAVWIILSTTLLPDGAWAAFFLSVGIVWLVAALSGLGPAYLLKRSALALPFALAALTSVFASPGQALAVWQIGPWRLVPTDAGLLRFTSILTRSWISVQAAVLLTAVTSFPDLMVALRSLRVPNLLVTIISFLYRYLFVLGEETQRMLRARQARSASLPGRNSGGALLWRAKVAGGMAGQLFLRSYERSERVYGAMLARGYRGVLLSLRPHRIQPDDRLAGLLAFLTGLILQVVGRIT